jgi:hypothetical protein
MNANLVALVGQPAQPPLSSFVEKYDHHEYVRFNHTEKLRIAQESCIASI